MTESAGDRDDTDTSDSSHPHEPGEPDLPGEDNPGERLIAKYDPTVDADDDPGEEHIPDSDDVDVPQDTARLFWYLVAVFNLAIVGLAVGILLIVFQNRWTLGGQITIGGAVLLAYGYYRYRKHAGDKNSSEGSRAERSEQDGGTDVDQPGDSGSERNG